MDNNIKQFVLFGQFLKNLIFCDKVALFSHTGFETKLKNPTMTPD